MDIGHSFDRAAYDAFLAAKAVTVPDAGFDLPAEAVNPTLFRHQPDIVRWAVKKGRAAIFASFGLGKCHGIDTPIMMADGSIKPVQHVDVGDALMGDDGTPRRVLSLARGREEMFRITLKNGDSYTCNASHVLALRVSNAYGRHQFGDTVTMTLREFLGLPEYAKRNCFKHYKVGLDFAPAPVPMDAYLYGAWLGDGRARGLTWTINDRDQEIVSAIRDFAQSKGLTIREEEGRGCRNYHVTRPEGARGRAKHVPEFYFVQDSVVADEKRIDPRYLRNSRAVRLELLSGLLDTDGHLVDKVFEITTKWAGLRDDILYLARSLGFRVSHREKRVGGVAYHRINIAGDTHLIPCRTRKKAGAREQIKNPLVFGFDVEPLGEGDYFGFTIDGNHLYLLGDFTVTHNTVMQLEIERAILGLVGPQGRGLIVMPLGVRQEFARDAAMLGIPVRFIRRSEEVDGGGIYLTNYESVREGKVNPDLFDIVSLDEAAVLRGFGGTKTFRELMRMFGNTTYRIVATATPSPNEYIELLAYAAFLGVMEVGEAKTRFFKRDSSNADKLTLHPHKEAEFWQWVGSWAVFCTRPSDLGHDDTGYDLPPVDIRWHEVPSDHSQAGEERDGQIKMFRDAAVGVSAASAEKRNSLPARIARMMAIRAEEPEAHRIIWHDLEAEREAIETAIPGIASAYGSQDLDARERVIMDFANGAIPELAVKPSIAGTGCNFQRHCARAIFLGIGFKFHEFIQALHRIVRFGQAQPVRIDLIYTEAEREIRRSLEAKWARHVELVEIMRGIVRQHGLGLAGLRDGLRRTLAGPRQVAEGERWRLVNDDTVVATAELEPDSVGLMLTSIPFATQYEYTPTFNDFGHTDDNAHFWRQMDFLTPSLLRALMPGRVLAVHVKDRITPGGINGFGFQTLHPFSDEAVAHYTRHGFAFLARITITTDVVRENNQTYRLGWTEQCKDGSRMGVGVPEYLLLFRKPPTDRSTGYADVPVVKEKPLCADHGEPAPFDPKTNWRQPVPGTGYSRARWQLDAHGFHRSGGNRLLTPEELRSLPHEQLYKRWREYCRSGLYSHEDHVRVCEQMDAMERLPSTFMQFPPHSIHDEVWTDIARMRTLNAEQVMKGKEVHLCPLQEDICDRTITRFSMPDELVYDPFAGIGSVPVRAVLLGRRGAGAELSPRYWADAVGYLRAAEAKADTPTLFDLAGIELDPANDAARDEVAA
jgi:hypothetical protein